MDNKKLLAMRHSCEHVLQQAMLKLYPGLKMAHGPAIENGFYFDFELPKGVSISKEDFPKIEKEMKKIIKKNLPFIKKIVSAEEAKKIFADNPYKQELIEEIIKRGEEITLYYTGQEFVDLCSGPHVNFTGEIGPFKLLSIAGAYWRGDEKNKMLTRIYGTCFFTKEELEKYLWQIEEAKKRDHRKLGKELEIFLISEEVGPGLVIWLPNGAIIRRQIENLIVKEQIKRGYQFVYTPHIGRKSLWITSGHWDLYQDKMYAPMTIDEEEYLVKPMNCPMHMMVYKSKIRSYRELPIRIAENATVYRYEKAGELSGLLRVRYITQDDAHIFCREDQVIDEFLAVFDYISFLLKTFGLLQYYLRLGVRSKSEKYLGDDHLWQQAEEKIITAIHKRKLNFIKSEGDAAFYGPKLDVIVKDALGRDWQCSTIQVDFMLPERFKLEYVDKDGKIKRPVLIHRAPLGSIERWVGLLIEHYKGAFPLWLSPLQVVILPVSSQYIDFSEKIFEILSKEKIRTKLDSENKTLNAKIRNYTLQKVPYLIIIGKKEKEKSEKEKKYYVTIRTREKKILNLVNFYEFVLQLKKDIENYQ